MIPTPAIPHVMLIQQHFTDIIMPSVNNKEHLLLYIHCIKRGYEKIIRSVGEAMKSFTIISPPGGNISCQLEQYNIISKFEHVMREGKNYGDLLERVFALDSALKNT